MTTNAPSGPGSSVVAQSTYTYDPVGHLASIDISADADDSEHVAFSIDALGRHAAQMIGPESAPTTTTTYAYLGTSDTVSSGSDGTSLTYSAIDAIGDRLTSGTPSTFAYLLPDLHGNVVATMASGSGPSYSAAYRYDAWGETCDSYSSGSTAVDSPWRFQGRILESATGQTDLYDFSARSYDPSLGAFTSFDSVSGSAQNPLTLNRYLYANANPATLVDPDGHFAQCVSVAVVATAAGPESTLVVGGGCVVATAAVAAAAWVALQLELHPEWAASAGRKVDEAGRAVVGVGDWGLQKTTQGVEWLLGVPTAKAIAQSSTIASRLIPRTGNAGNPAWPPEGPTGPGDPFKGFPPLLKALGAKLLLAGIVSLVTASFSGGETHDGSGPDATPRPTGTSRPTPIATPTPSPTSSPPVKFPPVPSSKPTVAPPQLGPLPHPRWARGWD